jgi:GTPase SAR1 family protein
VYKQTIGVDFYERQMKIRERSVVLQVWDVGGQSVASGMLPQYIFGAAVLFLCYDVTDTNSFADAQDWLGLAKLTLDKVCEEEEGKMVPSNNEKNLNSKMPRPAIFVVGNKVDLEHLRRVTKDQHDRFIT